ncbi:pectin degradation protein [Klebsiella michiganensis]|nr:pectin degradation protein [Klebsiella michiganensis]
MFIFHKETTLEDLGNGVTRPHPCARWQDDGG